MEIYDVEQRVQIINFYFQYQSSIQEMFPALLDFMLSTIVLFFTCRVDYSTVGSQIRVNRFHIYQPTPVRH